MNGETKTPRSGPNSAQLTLQNKVDWLTLNTRSIPEISPPRLKELQTKFDIYFSGAVREAELAFARKDHAQLFKIAHNLRGEAGSVGFPNAGRIAGLLTNLVRGGPPASWRQVHAHLVVLKRLSEDGRDQLPPGIVERLAKLC